MNPLEAPTLKRGATRYLWEFPDWRTVLATADQPAPDDASTSRNPSYGGWDGGKDFPATLEDARRGWPDGTAKARKLSAQFRELLGGRVERIDWSYDVEPRGNLDVARYLEGEPECWMVPDVRLIEGRGNRHVHVVFNGSATAAFKSDTLTRRGAIAVALVELLELAGISTAITLVWHSESTGSKRGGSFTIRVPLKNYGENVDIDRIAFAVAHPGAFRRIGFAVKEQMPEAARRAMGVGSGYGRASDLPVEERGDVYFGATSGKQFETDEASVAFLLKELERLGVTVREN